MISSSEQPPKGELCCDHECVCEDLILYIRSILPEDKCAFMACKDVIRDFKCPHDTRRHPNSTMTLPIQTCNICEIAGACDDEFGADNYPPCVHRAVIEAARKAREEALVAFGKEICDRSHLKPRPYDPNDCEIPQIGLDELAEIMDATRERLRSHPQHSEQVSEQ